MKKLFLFFYLSVVSIAAFAAEQFVIFTPAGNHFPLVANGVPCPIYIDSSEDKGVMIAAGNLQQDILQVCGEKPELLTSASSKQCIIAGTYGTPFIKKLMSAGKIDKKELDGKNEKYILQVIANPCEGIDEAVVIIGSDRRGTIYGIYELSEQMGVSPWYWWADVPVMKQPNVYIKPGQYSDGEPAVTYRGIFLNDEAPCLTQWVKHTYSTNYGDHRFYARVCELILRLKGNFLWPAMWNWAFYADDLQNSKTASEMGVIIGTSHHEPMARNHQEWSRKRKEYGAWDYTTNKKVIDQFFREGIERMQGTEDIVTIGMRGDGDAAMSKSTNVKLLENVVKNQRKIIEEVTKRPAKETPQVWALYKEVLDYYDKGMRVPDPVMQEVLANVHIPETSDTWFRHAPIDTLYSRHSYTYFCFVSSAYVGDVDDIAAAGDSVLILTSESSFSRYPVSAGVLPLPESAISYILPYGAPIAFFRVDSVVKTGNSFRYKLSRSR